MNLWLGQRNSAKTKSILKLGNEMEKKVIANAILAIESVVLSWPSFDIEK